MSPGEKTGISMPSRLGEREDMVDEASLGVGALEETGVLGALQRYPRRVALVDRAPGLAAPELAREVPAHSGQEAAQRQARRGRVPHRREPRLLAEIVRQALVAHEPSREPPHPVEVLEQCAGVVGRTGGGHRVASVRRWPAGGEGIRDSTESRRVRENQRIRRRAWTGRVTRVTHNRVTHNKENPMIPLARIATLLAAALPLTAGPGPVVIRFAPAEGTTWTKVVK